MVLWKFRSHQFSGERLGSFANFERVLTLYELSFSGLCEANIYDFVVIKIFQSQVH
jgi:hypothetical protein